ncbi:MAG: efflux RND transporter permease subunit [Spirochaetaceae bacterium]|jgi:HAE1 family hydrophobic/amphiphilic exporter-1|nr:efflux RND transporter permease subunit [Spirochaetaceae bacterium]
MKIADYAIKHPVVILMSLIVLVVFGAIAALSLRRNLIADMSLPTLAVVTTWPGVGPEDIEREITNPLEDALGTLEGLNQMSSISQNSVSLITLELGYNEDADAKISDIREKINGVMDELPDDISSPPEIFLYSTSQLPIMTILVEGEGSRSELSTLCRDEIVPTLSRIPGVARVNVNGDSREVVEITADIDLLRAAGLSVLDIAKILPASNVSLPGGDGIYQGYHLSVRTEGRYRSLGDIEDQVLAIREGHYIRLRDVAEVKIQEGRRDNYVLSGGRDSLVLFVAKQRDGDSIAISRDVRRILGVMEQEYAGGLSFVYLKDDSDTISISMNAVFQSAIMGAILAVIVLLLFLHNRNTTLIVGLAIPLSILFTFIGLWAKGSSLDLITLGGLTAAIGMVVDASIVVLENIQRHFDAGMDKREAASLGTDEVGGAVAASTATTLAAFFPILFLSGLAGIILRDVAWTIIFALLSSLFVAIIVVPFLCALFLKKEKTNSRLSRHLMAASEGGMDRLSRYYEKLLRGALASKRSFLTGTVILLIVSVLSFRILGFEFLAQTDMAELELSLETPGGYTLEMTREKTALLEREIQTLLGPELESAYFVVGQADIFGSRREANRAYGSLRLSPAKARKRHVTRIIADVQDALDRRIPDLKVTVSNGGVSSLLSLATGGEGFVVIVSGNNLDSVIAGAEQVRQYMRADPNVASTDNNIRFNQREMSMTLIHQYLGTLGLSSSETALANRIVFNGLTLGSYYGSDENIPIELKTGLSGGVIPLDVLYGLQVNTADGRVVSLANFAELETEEKVSQIVHHNKARSVTVRAALRDPNVRETSRRFTALVTERGLVPGVSWEIGGTTEELLSSFRSLVLILAIAIFLVYAVMVIQFERFSQPLLIMSAVPFTMIGISGGLLAFGSSLNIVSLLGIIALAGVVVNNAIILIDYTNLLRDRYRMPLDEAIVTGAVSRLKPILMTTMTTLLGVVPLAIGMGEGSEIYAPLGQSIFGGLFSSTFITLFFIPVIYRMLEKRKEKARERKNYQGESFTPRS